MNTTILKKEARKCLQNHYSMLIVSLILMQCLLNIPILLVNMNTTTSMTSTVIQMSASLIVSFLSAIFLVGQNKIYLSLSRGEECSVQSMWYGFRYCADNTILCYLFILLRILICSIPLFIAAVIYYFTRSYMLLPFLSIAFIFLCFMAILVTLNYNLTYYYLIDYPDLNIFQAMKLCKQNMRGYRFKYFYLYLSFTGLYILVLFSLGIGLLWVYPYTRMTLTKFYEEINKEAVES